MGGEKKEYCDAFSGVPSLPHLDVAWDWLASVWLEWSFFYPSGYCLSEREETPGECFKRETKASLTCKLQAAACKHPDDY